MKSKSIFYRNLAGMVLAGSLACGVLAPAPAATLAAGVNETSQNKLVSKTEDGRDLVSSLVFGIGTSVEELSNLPSLSALKEIANKEQSPEQLTAVEDMLNSMDKRSPELFEKVADELRSGDPFRVERGLERISEAVTKELKTTKYKTKATNSRSAADASPAAVVVVVAVFHAGAAVTGLVVALVEAVAVGGALVYKVNWVVPASERDTNQDIMVADIAEALS